MKKIALFLLISSFAFAHADVDVRLIVAGCNNDTVCQIHLGEDINSCPNDCTYIAPTSTPPVTPLPTGGESAGPIYGNGGNDIWQFENVKFIYGDDSVIMSWNTTRPTKSSVSWGRTDDYSEGTVSEIEYIREHTSKITNIIPGRRYVFRITASDASDTYAQYTGNFIIQKDPVYMMPVNVSNFRSFTVPTGNGLRWENLNDSEYAYVRILRSSTGYPLGPTDGKVVYEGRGRSFVDIDVVDGERYYYAAFVRDSALQYSSGALLAATKYKDGISPIDSDTGFIFQNEIPLDTTVTSKKFNLPIQDIDFIQDEEKISFITPNIPVNANKSLTISIPKFEWSVVFLTLSSGGQTFLVGYNNRNGRLEVSLPPFETDQPIEYSLQILNDGKFYQLQRGVFDTYLTEDVVEKKNAEKNVKKWQEMLLIIPLAILLYAFMWLIAKKKMKEERK